MPPRGGKGQRTPLSRKSTPREPSSGTGGTSGPVCVASLRSSRVLCVSNVHSPPEADCVLRHVRGQGWGRGCCLLVQRGGCGLAAAGWPHGHLRFCSARADCSPSLPVVGGGP